MDEIYVVTKSTYLDERTFEIIGAFIEEETANGMCRQLNRADSAHFEVTIVKLNRARVRFCNFCGENEFDKEIFGKSGVFICKSCVQEALSKLK